MYVVLGVLAVFVALIALAWFVVLRRLDEGDFEAGGRLAPAQAWSEARQLEREEHAGASRGMEDAKDRNVGRSWGG